MKTKNELARWAVIQIVLAVYCIMGIGVILKLGCGSPAPDVLARYIRDYGFVFLIFSGAWWTWAIVESNIDQGNRRQSLASPFVGTVLIACLGCGALFGTMSALIAQPVPGAVWFGERIQSNTFRLGEIIQVEEDSKPKSKPN